MAPSWELKSFVTRSKYRHRTIEVLATVGEVTPTGIADRTGLPQPHVSRALNELRDRDLVELLVPEEQPKGRYYGLTDMGAEIAEVLASENDVEWRGLKAELAEEDREIVSFLRARYGPDLWVVVTGNRDFAEVLYLDESVEEEFPDPSVGETLLRSARAAIRFYEQRRRFRGPLQYDLVGTEELQLLLLFGDGGRYVVVVLAPDANVLLPDVADAAAALLDL